MTAAELYICGVLTIFTLCVTNQLDKIIKIIKERAK